MCNSACVREYARVSECVRECVREGVRACDVCASERVCARVRA